MSVPLEVSIGCAAIGGSSVLAGAVVSTRVAVLFGGFLPRFVVLAGLAEAGPRP
ncbi:hypothetical protein GHK86_05990 [Acidimicrobiaceae bacterium USS-CC1]|uniref:Uncharacterized protein n=1 Tax=Acidiferrimicrobium australe TaxID=2664430 RepID=A0ABW9QV67_9ACTN|nr:hypothetical protein [Acidiferrimicrobium australe]